jgi:hypothetical protein
LLNIALHATASQTERVVRDYRRCTAATRQRHVEESFRYYHDEHGDLVFKGRLRADQGALLVKALELVCDRESQDQPPADYTVTAAEQVAARRARALVELAEVALADSSASGASAERYQVHVHVRTPVEDVSAETSVSRSVPKLEDGPAITLPVLERLTCDASVVTYREDGDGNTLDVGRKTRTIPSALRRALKARDDGCRFPGCSHRRFVDAHHIRHWSHGGATKMSNLVTLCRYHHGLIHEAGYSVRHNDGKLQFLRPDKVPMPPCQDDHRDRVAPRVSAGTPDGVRTAVCHRRSLTPSLDCHPPDYVHIAWYLANFVPRENASGVM